uniref:Cytosol non-specific dipeptidase n=1 Tax=Segatella albensis TaxID=77768 RepID=Q5QQ26_9BACT|nr:aminoacyl dipeptidase [Segatella albensis]
MSTEIKTLKPQAVWEYFYDLTQIPRPTGQMDEVTKYVFDFGKRLGLETEQDEVGNIIIRKPATPGYEHPKIVILQSHLDMVCQKNAGKDHDFTNDPIEAYIDGEWVKARGTTLGADNGIGLASALAILADPMIEHGPIEALFTIDEEVGMDGAKGLKPGFLNGDILLNVDSEDEGEVFVGCAGGMGFNVTLDFNKEELVWDGGLGLKISLTGLKGGHSGGEIHLGLANANKLLLRFLKGAVVLFRVRLTWLQGGSLRNAIPREAFGVIALQDEEVDAIWDLVFNYQDLLREELTAVEENFQLEVRSVGKPPTLIPEEIQDCLLNAVQACVNGVHSMSEDVAGAVESSSNLGLITAKQGLFYVQILVRSSSESQKIWIASGIESVFELAGAKMEFEASYPGWQPNVESPILKLLRESYEEFYGQKPAVKVIHAGLECGIIQGLYPDMDMISIGPTLRSPHSPDERIHIETVQATWDLLVKLLKRV